MMRCCFDGGETRSSHPLSSKLVRCRSSGPKTHTHTYIYTYRYKQTYRFNERDVVVVLVAMSRSVPNE